MKYVTLFHGSPIENKESILKYGIKYHRPDINRMISNALDKIEKKLGVKLNISKSERDFIVDRIFESTKKGGIVYLSADKEYAKSNALAGREWFESLLQRAIYLKFKSEYDKRRKLNSKMLKIQRQLDSITKKMRVALSEGDYDKYKSLSRKENSLYAEYVNLEKLLNEIGKKETERERKIEKLFYSRKAVLFKIVMPYNVFKRLAVGITKDDIKLFENRNWVGHKHYGDEVFKVLFREVWLKKVPRKYIRGYETFEKVN